MRNLLVGMLLVIMGIFLVTLSLLFFGVFFGKTQELRADCYKIIDLDSGRVVYIKESGIFFERNSYAWTRATYTTETGEVYNIRRYKEEIKPCEEGYYSDYNWTGSEPYMTEPEVIKD